MLKNGQVITIINEKRANEKGLKVENHIKALQGKQFILRIKEGKHFLEFFDGRLVVDEKGDIADINSSLLIKVENPKVKELKVGDKVTFLDVLSPFKRYGETIASMYMASFKGRQCTISHINEDNTFEIKEDDKNFSFSRGMTKEYTNIEDFVVDLDYLKEQDIAICCKSAEENKKLFEVLNELDVTWCDGDALVWDNDWEFVSEDEDCFSLTQNGKLEYCNSKWYWEHGYRVVNFDDIQIAKNK